MTGVEQVAAIYLYAMTAVLISAMGMEDCCGIYTLAKLRAYTDRGIAATVTVFNKYNWTVEISQVSHIVPIARNSKLLSKRSQPL